MTRKIILLIIILLLLSACNSPGVRELRGINDLPARPDSEPKPLPGWSAGMPPELVETTRRILEEVMVPEHVVMVLICVTQDRGDGEVGLACMSVHPGVFAVAAEGLRDE